jgi:hypothetical protein
VADIKAPLVSGELYFKARQHPTMSNNVIELVSPFIRGIGV